MKRLLSLVLCGGLVAPLAKATPVLTYEVPANILINQQLTIDAINFVNHGSIVFGAIPYVPFETFDTLNYTNEGLINLTVGWRFDHANNETGRRDWSANFVNKNPGSITATDRGNTATHPLGLPCVLAIVDPSYLLVSATNIITQAGAPSAGASLTAGPNGEIRLEGRRVDLSRSGIQILPVWNETFGDFLDGGPPPTEFRPDIAVHDQLALQAAFTQQNPLLTDTLWDGFNATAPPENNGQFPGFTIAPQRSDSFISSLFQVAFTTNFVTVTNIFQDTNNVPPCSVTNIGQNPVAVPITLRSNVIKGAIFIAVPSYFPVPQAGFAGVPGGVQPFGDQRTYVNSSGLITAILSNAVTGLLDSALVGFRDSLAGAGDRGTLPNEVGCGAVTQRPLNYRVDRTTLLFNGTPGLGVPAPDFFTSSSSQPLDPANIGTDSVTNPVVFNGAVYSAYEALFDNIVSRPPAVPGGDVTNYPGRVNIIADTLDLSKTRIRGEGLIHVRSPHLISSAGAVIDAENLSYNFASTNGILRIENLTPPTGEVQRFRGPVSFFSAVWQNTVTVELPNNYVFTNVPVVSPCNPTNIIGTNSIVLFQTNVFVNIAVAYQVTMVDGTGLTTVVPVNVFEFVTRSPNIVVNDNMNVVERLFIDGKNLTLNGNLTIPGSFPIDPLTGFALTGLPLFDFKAANAPNLQNFTNTGTFSIFNEAHFGDDRPFSYLTFSNSGIITASSIGIDSRSFQNSGSLTSQFGINITTENGKLENGNNVSGASGSSGATTFTAKSLKFNNYQIISPGRLTFTVTDSLSDAGVGSANAFQVRDGFALLRKPLVGDLLGTTVFDFTPAVPSVRIDHLWAGEDRGPTPAGYLNNVAIGTLQLAPNSIDPLYHFAGTGAHNALYVDTLDLSQLDDYTNHIEIANNMVIYFANATVNFVPPNNTNGFPQQPEEFLNGQFGGRLRWVPTYAGASGTPVLINGQVVQVNTALFNSQIIDSDNDSIPNAFDNTNTFLGTTVPIVVQVVGNGTVSPDLNGATNLLIGETYSIQAIPGDGAAFSGWTGSIETNSPVLNFVAADGLVFVANFTFAMPVGSFNGLFFESTGVEFERSGFITITTTKTGKCSGSILVGGQRYSFTGQLDENGAGTIGIPNSGLEMEIQVGARQVTGTIGDGLTWTADVLAERAVFNTKTNKAPFAGPYTMIIQGTTVPTNTLPLGDGYATIKVQPTGKLQLKGTLADGTKISQSTTAGGEGQWPFYVPLYKGQGQILGWLTFENRADRDVGGLVSWIKPADDAKFYPDGFNFETVASGSTYNPSLDPVSGFDFATVKLLGGNLPFDLFESVLINTNNKVSSFGPDKTTLSLNPSQGLFKVTVVNTNIHTTVKGNGVILQKQIIGSGFFLGTNQSGRVTIEPAL